MWRIATVESFGGGTTPAAARSLFNENNPIPHPRSVQVDFYVAAHRHDKDKAGGLIPLAFDLSLAEGVPYGVEDESPIDLEDSRPEPGRTGRKVQSVRRVGLQSAWCEQAREQTSRWKWACDPTGLKQRLTCEFAALMSSLHWTCHPCRRAALRPQRQANRVKN